MHYFLSSIIIMLFVSAFCQASYCCFSEYSLKVFTNKTVHECRSSTQCFSHLTRLLTRRLVTSYSRKESTILLTVCVCTRIVRSYFTLEAGTYIYMPVQTFLRTCMFHKLWLWKQATIVHDCVHACSSICAHCLFFTGLPHVCTRAPLFVLTVYFSQVCFTVGLHWAAVFWICCCWMCQKNGPQASQNYLVVGIYRPLHDTVMCVHCRPIATNYSVRSI